MLVHELLLRDHKRAQLVIQRLIITIFASTVFSVFAHVIRPIRVALQGGATGDAPGGGVDGSVG